MQNSCSMFLVFGCQYFGVSQFYGTCWPPPSSFSWSFLYCSFARWNISKRPSNFLLCSWFCSCTISRWHRSYAYGHWFSQSHHLGEHLSRYSILSWVILFLLHVRCVHALFLLIFDFILSFISVPALYLINFLVTLWVRSIFEHNAFDMRNFFLWPYPLVTMFDAIFRLEMQQYKTYGLECKSQFISTFQTQFYCFHMC